MGMPDNSTEKLLQHIDYAVQLIGPEHVGLGLDYLFDLSELEEYVKKDPEAFPASFRQVHAYRQVEPERFPVIAEGLVKLGYSNLAIQGIMGHNNLRVAREVWR
jgi:membrane dipeptidase